MSEKRIVADDIHELEGKARYELGRGIFLAPTRVLVGVATPRDVSDEPGDTDLKFDNTKLTEVEVELVGDKLVAEFPDRDRLYELYQVRSEVDTHSEDDTDA